VPPNLVGLFASAIFMVLGSIAPQLIRNGGHPIEQTLRHAAEHAHPHRAAGH
jgi:hypothetical protein